MADIPNSTQYASTPQNSQNNMRRSKPTDELDFSMRITDPTWHTDFTTSELRDLLSKEYILTDDEGQPIIDKKTGKPITQKTNPLAFNGYYNRDLRLGNISRTDSREFEFCRYYLSLAGDLLKEGQPFNMIEPFMICMSRSTDVLELSQSRNGFVRKEMSTLRQEQRHEILEPKNRTLFGGTPKN